MGGGLRHSLCADPIPAVCAAPSRAAGARGHSRRPRQADALGRGRPEPVDCRRLRRCDQAVQAAPR
eukprot:3025785-Prymnesium_polylepis.1